MRAIAIAVGGLALTACASTTPVLPAATSHSKFAGEVYSGETQTLGAPTQGLESFRLFQQGATGFVTLSAVREDVQRMATAHCERQGKGMRALQETDAKPPFILGNFPRVELIFECVDKQAAAAARDKYERLAELKKLLDNGALTQQEFDREKSTILSQP